MPYMVKDITVNHVMSYPIALSVYYATNEAF